MASTAHKCPRTYCFPQLASDWRGSNHGFRGKQQMESAVYQMPPLEYLYSYL